MPSENLLRWMHDEEHSVGYVARKSGIDADRLIDLITGAELTPDEVFALATLTGLRADDFSGSGQSTASGTPVDPLRCYTIAEAAAIMRVSQDTVRAEMKGDTLAYVVIGARAYRIPRWALEKRLMGHDGGRDESATTGTSRRAVSDAPTAPMAALL